MKYDKNNIPDLNQSLSDPALKTGAQAAPDETYPSADDDYSLEDEDEDDARYAHPEEDIDDNNDDKDGNDKPSPWSLLFRMMLNPIEGWKDIRRSRLNAEEVAAGMFYPCGALSAAACFLGCLYDSSFTLTAATMEAVKVFVSLFFGNFLVLMLEKLTLPKDYRGITDTNFGKVFVLYNLTTLAIFNLIYQAFPMLGPVLAFLPLWTIYLVIRGARFFKFAPEKLHLSVTLICLYIIGAPLAVYWVFDALL